MKQKLIEVLKEVNLLAEEVVVDYSIGNGEAKRQIFKVNGIRGMLPQVYFPIILAFCKQYDFHFYVDAEGDIPSILLYDDI